MKYTPNLNLKKPDYTDPADVKDFNDNMDKIDTSLGESTTILPAGGTANAITLPITTFQNGKKYSFKAVNASTGAVTINGKALKKLDGTAVSNIKANKIYDFFYDNTLDCVFILAKATGNALVGDVLAGKIFSNEDDTDLVGTATIASLGGKRWASGTIDEIGAANASSVITSYIQVTGLGFIPRTVIVHFYDDTTRMALFASLDMLDKNYNFPLETMYADGATNMYTLQLNTGATHACRTILGQTNGFSKQLKLSGRINPFTKSVKWIAFE